MCSVGGNGGWGGVVGRALSGLGVWGGGGRMGAFHLQYSYPGKSSDKY